MCKINVMGIKKVIYLQCKGFPERLVFAISPFYTSITLFEYHYDSFIADSSRPLTGPLAILVMLASLIRLLGGLVVNSFTICAEGPVQLCLSHL